jgi:ribonuclease HI
MKPPQVIIYCDGACIGNPGPGGYAALLMLNIQPLKERVVCGYEISTTNNRMELKAAIAGLQALKKKCQVIIYCDSQYVVKGITEWIIAWQKSGFKTSQKKPVANADLWQILMEISKMHVISWRWVRAHSGNEFNERVDEIAREQAGLAFHQLNFK